MNVQKRKLDDGEKQVIKSIFENNLAQVLDFREFSINQEKDGSVKVFFYSGLGSYCKTNKNQKDQTIKQFHCVQSWDDHDWYLAESGCGCVSFQDLDLQELGEDSLSQASYYRGSSAFVFRPASRC